MKIKNFSYSYQKKILFDNIDFYFEDCQVNFILGVQGSGLTTILDCLVEERCKSSFIGFPEVKQIGYLTQQNQFNVSLTVKDILDFANQLNAVNNLLMPEEIKRLLKLNYSMLNPIEKKLVLIYLNLIPDKELYLFDEPEVGLDLKSSRTILNWFRDLSELDKTVIVTTNKLDNISDTDNVNYIKNPQEILVDSFLKIKSRMAF